MAGSESDGDDLLADGMACRIETQQGVESILWRLFLVADLHLGQ